MAIELVSYRFKEQWHLHKCPSCKKIKHEPNTVCGRTSGDHIYRCLGCLSGYWRRFGDTFMDTYLDEDEFARFKALAPDQTAIDLDQRDHEKRTAQRQKKPDMRKAEHLYRPLLSPEEINRKLKEKRERLYDEADRLTEDEVKAEIEKIRKDEEIK